MTKQTVRAVLIVVGLLVLLVIVGFGAAAWLFVRSFEMGKTDETTAARQFDGVRARFAGVEPVMQIRGEEPIIVRRPPAERKGERLNTMHVLAWDANDDDLVRISLPFWLLRLKSGPIEIVSNQTLMSDGNLGITVDELERFGPTLVLDHHSSRGSRVLVWTE